MKGEADMPDKGKILVFAKKWLGKYSNMDTLSSEVEEGFADECLELEFKIDSGKAFEEEYPDALQDYHKLDTIIAQVSDIQLLGSAIFSKWRYITHWDDTGELLSDENRKWFITALGRLALITEDNEERPFVLHGQACEISIISNNICYGASPQIDDEVEQHLTIAADGNVWFKGYNYGDGFHQYTENREKQFKIDIDKAAVIMKTFTKCFSDELKSVFVTDMGSWNMEITNEEGKQFSFYGSLSEEYVVDGIDLSDMLRDSLGMNDLFVFDGNDNTDSIENIKIDYHRITKIKPSVPASEGLDIVTWDYSERLYLDRETETIEYIRNIGTGCKLTYKFEIEEGVSSFLDALNADDLFSYVEGNPDNVVETPEELKEYRILVKYKKKPEKLLEGTFDKKGLPDDWPDFAERLLRFVYFYGIGEMVDSSVFSKVRRRADDYIYCSVEFYPGSKTYYYRTEDDSIEVGDKVIVPVGSDQIEKFVYVVALEYYQKDDVPLPLDKTKFILRKVDD